jgi:hypothetical protein
MYKCQFRAETNNFHEENSTAAVGLGEFEEDFLNILSATKRQLLLLAYKMSKLTKDTKLYTSES